MQLNRRLPLEGNLRDGTLADQAASGHKSQQRVILVVDQAGSKRRSENDRSGCPCGPLPVAPWRHLLFQDGRFDLNAFDFSLAGISFGPLGANVDS